MKKEYGIGFTYNASRGKGSNIRVITLYQFINNVEFKANRISQFIEFNGDYSVPISQISLERFEKVFSKESIDIMISNGRLNYFPNGCAESNGHVYTDVSTKYPIFKKEIYTKYGVELDKDREIVNKNRKK